MITEPLRCCSCCYFSCRRVYLLQGHEAKTMFFQYMYQVLLGTSCSFISEIEPTALCYFVGRTPPWSKEQRAIK